MSVQDDGVGIFERIALALGLTDRRLAPLELSKGKPTTDPTRHSGEGVFFTSRMFDRFQIEANGLSYGSRRARRAVQAAQLGQRAGTRHQRDHEHAS